MNKRLSAIILTAVTTLSLTACGDTPPDNLTKNDTAHTSNASIEQTESRNMPSITIHEEGDDTAIIIEGDLVKEFIDIAKVDKDAQFLVEFESDEEDEAPKKGFSLSFNYQNGDEPFALFHTSVTNKGYSNRNEDILSFSLKANKATWSLSGITPPLDGVKTVSIWLVSGDNEPIGEHYEMPIADVKMKSNVGADSEEEPSSSSSTEEKATIDYVGTYYSTDSTGKEYKVVVEENTLTVNDRYVADFTIDDVIRTYWRGTITDTKTGEKKEEADFQLQQLYEDGKDQMFLTLYAWFNEEQLLVEYAKRD